VGDVPAKAAIAVKVTRVPAQIVVAVDEIVMVGEIAELTTTVVLPVSEVQPFASVATAIHVPAYAEVTLLKTAVLAYCPPKPEAGFCIK